MSTVKNIMSRPVFTIKSSTKVYEAAEYMKEKGIGSLIVSDSKEQPLGIVTETDIIYKVVASRLSHETHVKDIMTKDLKTIREDETIDQAARVMAVHRIRRLPVVSDKKLVGVVALKDIVKAKNVDRESDYYPYFS